MSATPEEIAAIVRRVEQATGPDRELDALIWAVHDPNEHARICSFRGVKYAGHVHSKAEKRAHTLRMGQGYAPAYTASLDAAMTLVPEGWNWAVNTGERGAWCWFGDQCDMVGIQAATPALALTAAALKARALVDDGGKGAG